MKLPRLLFILPALLPAFLLLEARASQTKAAQAPPAGKTAGKTAAATAASKSAPAVSKAAPSKEAASKAAPSKAPASKAAAAKGAKKAPAAQRRLTQQQPDAPRTREIQQALHDRGYAVEPTGVWGPESVEALKKFQEDQNINNLTGRGKLDSLTLIALGLGPKRVPPPSPAAPLPKAVPEGKQQ